MSTRENPSSPAPAWTYRMEVSPTGQNPAADRQPQRSHPAAPSPGQPPEPDARIQRQMLEIQRQQLEISREMLQVNREQRARQGAELERWQAGHEHVIWRPAARRWAGSSRCTPSLMGELANYVEDNHENLLEGDFSLSDFVDVRPAPGPPQYDARRPPPAGRREEQDRKLTRARTLEAIGSVDSDQTPWQPPSKGIRAAACRRLGGNGDREIGSASRGR